MLQSVPKQKWMDIYYSSHDNLSLYARHYPAQFKSPTYPVVCLPGLTRNSQDFHKLATYLSTHATMPRDVYCVDYRGRGRSEYDTNWRNYTPLKEALDILDLSVVEGIHNATLIGTSRGGLLAMIIASIRPTTVGSVILNDIGPVIERDGLLRLKSYVGNTPTPKNWDEATKLIQDLNGPQFPSLSDEEWNDLARQFFLEADGKPLQSYDMDIAKPFSMIDFSQKIPSMWPQFKALAAFPLLTIRGELSDILSAECLQHMQQEIPSMRTIVVPKQGHAPLLNDVEIHNQIFDFINQTEGAKH